MNNNSINSLRYALASIWLLTGFIVLWIYPLDASIKLTNRVGLTGNLAYLAIYTGAIFDLLMGLLTLVKPSKALWVLQLAATAFYSLCIALFLPEFLVHPFGPILKNIPILTIIWLLYQNEDEYK